MGYNVDFVQVPTPRGTTFPVDADRAQDFLDNALPFEDPAAVHALLLAHKGAGPAPANNTIDFLGAGMSYARLRVDKTRVHVENNCSPKELLNLYEGVVRACPTLLIHDLQSGQLHTAESFMEWWSKPL